jgi:hypothetical protein
LVSEVRYAELMTDLEDTGHDGGSRSDCSSELATYVIMELQMAKVTLKIGLAKMPQWRSSVTEAALVFGTVERSKGTDGR